MRRWFFTLMALLLLSGFGVGMRTSLDALPPTTIEAAVAITLNRAKAPTNGIRIEDAHCVPARETCLSYIADVTLQNEQVRGRLACVGAWHDCTLTMAEYDLHVAPVPDVGTPHPWIEQIAAVLQQAMGWVRAVVGR